MTSRPGPGPRCDGRARRPTHPWRSSVTFLRSAITSPPSPNIMPDPFLVQRHVERFYKLWSILDVAARDHPAAGVVTVRRYLGSVDPITPRRLRRRPYRKRKPLPAMIILVLLIAAGTTVWAHVLKQAGNSTTQ